MREIFYNSKNQLIKLKDKGDSSDLTGFHINDSKHILTCTSKNMSNITVDNLDIYKLLVNYFQYDKCNYKMTLCISIKNIEYTNREVKKYLDDSVIIVDWSDLKKAFLKFKQKYQNIRFENLINEEKKHIKLKLHQHLTVLKTLQLKSLNEKILWGHIQRSGKSYIIAGCIIQDSLNKKSSNYLVITTAPNETIEKQLSVFDCLELKDFNVIFLNGNNIKPKLTNKNIILYSKQFLQSKIKKSIDWLKKMFFEITFIDESHNGGTTDLSNNILNHYSPNSFTVQITATYSKPINYFGISKDKWILWDLEDINLCKNNEK